MNDKWKKRYLELAEHVAQWSKDPSTQVGAVIVRPNKSVCSVGFNGFPAGHDDLPELYADREYKYKHIIHAEINAIKYACQNLNGFTLYTWPFLPCKICAEKVIESGITTVIAPLPSEDILSRWGDSLEVTRARFKEKGIHCEEI